MFRCVESRHAIGAGRTVKVMSIAVHPDDETLGCGGALLKHQNGGDSLHWLLVTSAHEPDFTPGQVALQRQQVELVKAAYPFETLDWLKLPTTRLETVPMIDLVNGIRETVKRVRPEMVFVPNSTDAHSDHRVVFLAASAALKSFYLGALGVRRVLAAEVLSETDAALPSAERVFLPNVFVDVSSTLSRKLEIMGLYKTELQPEPLPRTPSAVRALARCRGATMGVEYAEAFMLLRELV